MKAFYCRVGSACLGLVVLLFAAAGVAQQAKDVLKAGFDAPPASARPRVWWHWMNGNITKEGIKLDLDWMHRVGLAGFQNFDAALDTPQVVDKRLAYMTPEWKDAFKYAIQLGDQYGFEMAIAGSPGWSESGGPWVEPRQAMKKYVWSETRVEGGKPFHGALAHPPTTSGPFQMRHTGEYRRGTAPEFYADAVVVAFRRPASEKTVEELGAKVTGSGGPLDVAKLTDGDLETATGVAIPKPDETAWIQYAFPQAVTIHAVTFVEPRRGERERAAAGTGMPEKTLEASDDGTNWRKVIALEASQSDEHTIAFPAVTARYFRVAFVRTKVAANWRAGEAKAPTTFDLAELVLHPGARVNRWEEKAAFELQGDLYQFAPAHVDAADAIGKGDVVDLTGKMAADGTLDWTPPEGEWTVLRFGYSLLGITNHPATKEATGLEVDKLDRRYVRDYFEKYLDSYKETLGPEEMGKKGIQYVINDSYEAGPQNWTDKMLEQFKQLRGYDATPWLPVLSGRVVESAEASDRFLWDFRKTIADLVATEHYDELQKVLEERGMKHYGESHESGRAYICDGMEVKKRNDIPMSAMWVSSYTDLPPQYRFDADDRESASVAHIYGQNIAAAESLTSAMHPWGWTPGTLKPTADEEFLNGINRFVIHESAHQPLTDPKKVPGLSLGQYGQWFNRNDTWAQEAGPWINYLSRTSYMLQQGRFDADIVYFYGEDSNLTAIYQHKAPEIPAGYNFDYINADALIHELSVKDGALTTKSGMSYKVLGLAPYSAHISLPVLKAIRRLVEEGATVAGAKPVDDPSLADDQAEFKRLNDELFGDGTGTHTVGKGKVFAGQTLEVALKALSVAKDFEAVAGVPAEFVHRKLADGDVYWVDNRGWETKTFDAHFRVTGKAPELWYAEQGTAQAVSFTIANGRTTVPLTLEPWGTVFVVFRKTTKETAHTEPAVKETQLAAVDGPWSLGFEAVYGAPGSITADKLFDWSAGAEDGVKYFSGTGTYTKTVDAPAAWFGKGARLYLDLGKVGNIALVTVNGKKLGQVWHAPYRVDVTDALKPGANQVEVKVINAWANRLIGDVQPGATKHTFRGYMGYYVPDSELQPSGLMGPVTVVRAERQ